MKLTNKTVPISALRMSKHNWRRELTGEDIDDLAGNIEEIGNLHPIIVRPVGKAGTMYEVLAGRRRLEAQKVLGSKKIEVRVVKCDDVRAEIISYSENLKIKKPDSKEWSAGVKRLVDLFEQLYKVGVPPKSTLRVRSSTPEEATSTTKPGRPKNDRAQAIKDTAKSVGASEQSVRRAVKREEDLIPSAMRALELGTITQEQANLLAAMSVNEQKQQLRNMVTETREETRHRRNVERLQQLEDKKDALKDMLSNIYYECNDLKSKLDITMVILNNEELDTSELRKMAYFESVEKTRDALTDLLELLEK